MSEPRKIVVILGNGFDLDLGLNTSYKAFWESEFCPKKYPAPLIHHLNQRWKDNLEAVKWYDLENELLSYYKSIPDPNVGADCLTEEERSFLNEFTEFGQSCGWYNDRLELVQSLVNKGVLYYNGNPFGHVGEHLKNDALQSPIWRDHKALNLIKENLCKFLDKAVLAQSPTLTIAYQVLAFLDEEAIRGDSVNVYSFNYTPVRLMGRAPKAAIVHYVHGSCEEGNIIIGTRDDLSFVPTYDFLQKSFDTNYNPPALVEDMRNADEVVIFGHSIGENDRQYFKSFFMQQTDYSNPQRKDITIFTRDFNSELEIKRSLQNMTEGHLSTLYGLNNIQIIKTKNISEDQLKLYNFLVKHGKEDLATREYIGKLIKAQDSGSSNGIS